MDRVLEVLAEVAACGRGRRVDARRWVGLMVAVGWAWLVVLRDRGGNRGQPGAEPWDGAAALSFVAEAIGRLGTQCCWAMRCGLRAGAPMADDWALAFLGDYVCLRKFRTGRDTISIGGRA